MVVLIDILHPAHVHFFRHVCSELTQRGHRVIVVAREKEISIELLEAYGLEYRLLSRQSHGVGLVWELLCRTTRLLGICLKERPALMMGIMGPSIALVGLLLRIPAWVFYDTENAWITNWFAYPLARRVYTPVCYGGRRRKNQKVYDGYHELAYLHPTRFTPERDVVAAYGISPEERYFVVRFVGWQASHDIGERGIGVDDKVRLVELLEQYGRVYITSEAAVPSELADRVLKCSVEHIHHVLSFADMVLGESATMASESAVLGVPAVFISDTLRGYTIEEEDRYGLVRNFSRCDFDVVLEEISRMVEDVSIGGHAEAARQRMLSDKIDVTDYIICEIEAMSDVQKGAGTADADAVSRPLSRDG